MNDTQKCSICKKSVSIFEMSERGHLWLCSICTIAYDKQEEADFGNLRANDNPQR